MAPSTQARLLRTLQERKIRRVGGHIEVPVDVRVVCATHRDLEAQVREGRFREDLYFRLVVYPIHIPALRERRDDIPLLVAFFLNTLRKDTGRDVQRVEPEVMQALVAHDWPGNVRELGNVLHRAILSSNGSEIRLADLPPALRKVVLPNLPETKPPPSCAPREEKEEILSLREVERRAILRAMAAAEGNVVKAAKLLGIGRTTLYRRLSEDDMARDGRPRSQATKESA